MNYKLILVLLFFPILLFGQEKSTFTLNEAIDTRGWARNLQKMLKEKYQLESKLMMKGIGQAQLVIGEK